MAYRVKAYMLREESAESGTRYSISLVSNQIRLNSRTAALNMPMWVQGLSIPIGSFFCIIRSIEAGIGEFKRLNKEAKGVEAA